MLKEEIDLTFGLKFVIRRAAETRNLMEVFTNNSNRFDGIQTKNIQMS
jgi:hypothetical protein